MERLGSDYEADDRELVRLVVEFAQMPRLSDPEVVQRHFGKHEFFGNRFDARHWLQTIAPPPPAHPDLRTAFPLTKDLLGVGSWSPIPLGTPVAAVPQPPPTMSAAATAYEADRCLVRRWLQLIADNNAAEAGAAVADYVQRAPTLGAIENTRRSTASRSDDNRQNSWFRKFRPASQPTGVMAACVAAVVYLLDHTKARQQLRWHCDNPHFPERKKGRPRCPSCNENF